ncbi:hypothetical protein SB5387_04758 [Klebsiella variicola]|nr:hypothetical protein SB5387_04758 [Klebsiella variicola]
MLDFKRICIVRYVFNFSNDHLVAIWRDKT